MTRVTTDISDRDGGSLSRGQSAPRARRRRKGPGGIGRRPVWMVAPAAVLMVVLIAFPALVDAYISLFKVTIYTLSTWYAAPFAAFGNYVQAVTENDIVTGTVLHALWVSVSFAVVTTVIATPIGFIAAISINDQFKGRGALRGWFLVPYVIPGVVVAMIGRVLFLNPGGLVDDGIRALGLNQNVLWLAGSNAFWAMIVIEVWAAWPLTYIMVSAGLSAVDDDLYDAAEVDGAGYMGKVRHVVLPQVRNMLLLSIVVSTIFHLGNFTLAFVMFSTPPPPAVDVLPVDIYYNAFIANNYSLAAAIAVVMVIVVSIPGVLYLRVARVNQATTVQS